MWEILSEVLYLESIFKKSVVEKSMSQEESAPNNGKVEELAEDKTTKVDVIPKINDSFKN